MPAPIAVQLYTVREALAASFEEVIRQIAAIGYKGVEPFNFAGTTPAAAGKLFRELGLAVPSAHQPLPLGERRQEVLEAMAAVDCPRIVSGLGPDQFTTADRVRAACDQFNEANRVAREAGRSFGIHNHWWEFGRLDGRYIYELMLDRLDPTIFFELDIYWVQTAGPDPAAIVAELGSRAPLLHVKDGPANDPQAPMTAVGQGTLDIPAILRAGAGTTDWLIVELDRCATDMMTAVADSYQYLTREGLADGNK